MWWPVLSLDLALKKREDLTLGLVLWNDWPPWVITEPQQLSNRFPRRKWHMSQWASYWHFHVKSPLNVDWFRQRCQKTHTKLSQTPQLAHSASLQPLWHSTNSSVKISLLSHICHEISVRRIQNPLSMHSGQIRMAVVANGRKSNTMTVGTYWFTKLCGALQLDESTTFRSCLKSRCPDMLAGNYNHAARSNAGLQQEWYDRSSWPDAASAKPDSVQWESLNDQQISELQSRLAGMIETETNLAGSNQLAYS